MVQYPFYFSSSSCCTSSLLAVLPWGLFSMRKWLVVVSSVFIQFCVTTVQVQTPYETVYGVFNLNCLSEHFGTLDVICLEYVIAVFPLVMIVLISVICQCTSRCRCQCVNSSMYTTNLCTAPQNTLLHAFVSFVLLSYTIKFSYRSI